MGSTSGFANSIQIQPTTSYCSELLSDLRKVQSDFGRDQLEEFFIRFLTEEIPSRGSNFSFKSLNDVDPNRDHISEYTSAFHARLNAELAKDAAFRSRSTVYFRNRLIEELAEQPTAQQVVYSGLTPYPDYLSQMKRLKKQGKPFRLEYFLSSSKKSWIAQLFASRDHGPGRVKIVLMIHGQTGSEVENVSASSKEEEVIFKPGTEFEIVQIKIPPRLQWLRTFSMEDKVFVELKEIPKLAVSKVASASKYSFDSEIDGLRFGHFVDLEHIAAAHRTFVQSPMPLPLNADTLKAVHAAAMQGHHYIGYARRRIRHAFKGAKLSLSEAVAQLMLLETGATYEDAATHQRLTGRLRDSHLDDFIYSGDHLDQSSRRYLTPAEFAAISENPLFGVFEHARIRPDKMIDASFSFVPSSRVEDILEEILRAADQRLANASNDETYLRTLAILHKELISLHPFLDGNGRTVRLLIDMLLAQRGLALPLRPIQNDYTSSVDELVEQYKVQMRAWLELKIQLGQR